MSIVGRLLLVHLHCTNLVSATYIPEMSCILSLLIISMSIYNLIPCMQIPPGCKCQIRCAQPNTYIFRYPGVCRALRDEVSTCRLRRVGDNGLHNRGGLAQMKDDQNPEGIDVLRETITFCMHVIEHSLGNIGIDGQLKRVYGRFDALPSLVKSDRSLSDQIFAIDLFTLRSLV